MLPTRVTHARKKNNVTLKKIFVTFFLENFKKNPYICSVLAHIIYSKMHRLTHPSLKFLISFLFILTYVESIQANMNLLFTTDHNLPNSLINEVKESADEMIWIATEDGLCRFDGSQFITYRNDPSNPNSLQSDFVRTLCTDDKGHVMVGTLSGVQMYRPESDDFTPLIINPDQNITSGNINDLCLLSNGDFMATGYSTFTIHFDEEGQPHAVANPLTSKTRTSFRCCEDYQHNVWVISFEEGIYRMDRKGTVSEIPAGYSNKGFTSLGLGPDGRIYAGGSQRGLFRYNPNANNFEELSSPTDNYMVRELRAIPNTQQMYVCTDGEGIFIFDCVSDIMTPYVFDDAQIDTRSQKVHSLAISRNGDVWMALFQKGVFVISHNAVDFHYYGPKSLRYNSVGDRCITSLIRDHAGYMWVGTDNGGLYRIDNEGQTNRYFPCTSDPKSIPSSIMNLFEDSSHRLWVGSYRQGGGIIDTRTGVYHQIPIENEINTTSNIYDFEQDKRGTLWAASMGQGLLRYDEEKGIFKHQQVISACDWSGALCYDPLHDALYLGTYNGLVIFHPGDTSKAPEHYLDPIVIYSITRCSATEISLCTNEGLIMFNTQTHNYETYKTQEGLPSNNVFASQTDGEGNLWVSSGTSLSKFNMQQKTFNNYTIQDGLQSNEFYKNASMRDEDGTLWFGGTMGITWFNPHEITHKTQNCTARIVRLSADQNQILPDANGVYQISNEDHSFTLELATRPILLTHSVTYRYSMDNDPWQTLPSLMNRVSFSHMSSGSHTFRFQVLQEDNTSEVETVNIFIERPWYRTWWASLIWFAILGGIIWLIYQLLRRHRIERKLKLEKERERAINEGKLQLFMNIAHEFRTPMTLVVSPLQKLMKKDNDAETKQAYELINRNANRVLALVNELMDLRKIDQSQMKLQCHLQNIVPFLRNLCDSVLDLTEVRNITLSYNNSIPETEQYWFDEEALTKIVLNLLTNSIKFTPKGGRITLSSSIRDDKLRIMVSDTGIGIPPIERKFIFNRFYQVRQSGATSLGTGIGLNLVHSLVQLHHGTIEVDDNTDGKGTCFTIHLPIDEKAYSNSEKLERTQQDTTNETLPTSINDTTVLHDSLADSAESIDDKPENAHAPRILVVDDDYEVRSYLELELGNRYRVSTSVNGREALEMLLAQPDTYSLVVTDLMMPEMNGIQLCMRIRSNVQLNAMPIILLTAKSSDEDRLESLEVGANAFISKPFNVEILHKTIQNLLEQQRRLRSNFSGSQNPADKVDTPELLSPDERLMQRVLKVINERLSDTSLTGEKVAEEVGLSRVHLYRKLKELTNQSPRNYIRNIRLIKAAELLSQKKMSIAEVAYSVGFSSPDNFSSLFKEMYGVSPKEYNEQHYSQQEE